MADSTGDNLKRSLEATFGLLRDLPTRAEFMTNFEQVLKFVADFTKGATQTLRDIAGRCDDAMKAMKADHANDLAKTEKQLRQVFDGLAIDQRRGLSFLYDKVRSLKNGYTPIKGVDYFDGDPGEPGPPGSPDTGDDIIRKINGAQTLIEPDAVRGLNALEEKVNKIELRPVRGFFGGAKGFMLYVDGTKKGLTVNTINLVAGANVTLLHSYANGRNDITISASASGGSFSLLTATGSVNDSNTAFTFASKPSVVVINGQSYRENHGWTWTGATLTATLDNPVGTGGDIYGIG